MTDRELLEDILKRLEAHLNEWQRFRERVEPLLQRGEQLLRLRMPWQK
jgi:hypothetical protein